MSNTYRRKTTRLFVMATSLAVMMLVGSAKQASASEDCWYADGCTFVCFASMAACNNIPYTGNCHLVASESYCYPTSQCGSTRIGDENISNQGVSCFFRAYEQ